MKEWWDSTSASLVHLEFTCLGCSDERQGREGSVWQQWLFLEHLETATLSFPKVSISTVVLSRVFNKLFFEISVDVVVVIVF